MYKDTVSDMIKKLLPLLLIPSSFLSLCPSTYIDVFILCKTNQWRCFNTQEAAKQLTHKKNAQKKLKKKKFGCVVGKLTLQHKFNAIVIHAVLLDSKSSFNQHQTRI